MEKPTEATAMLRITTEEKPQGLTLRLEGRLEGPWMRVAVRSWRSVRDRSNGKRLRVDLTDTTFISAAGKALLEEMYQHGAELIADDLMTKAIVDEIASPKNVKGESR
jgi:hypothetical protein